MDLARRRFGVDALLWVFGSGPFTDWGSFSSENPITQVAKTMAVANCITFIAESIWKYFYVLNQQKTPYGEGDELIDFAKSNLKSLRGAKRVA